MRARTAACQQPRAMQPLDAMDPALFRSAIAENAWPAMPTARGSTFLAMQFQLQQSERLPPDAIRQAQFRQLKNLIRHAIATVPHYRSALGSAGIDPANIDAPGE